MSVGLCALLRTLAATILLTASASAHEGHSHDEPAPAPAVAGTPSGAGQSASFEAVALARGGELVIYIDRFATNEPVLGAVIEIDTPAGPTKAVAREDGTYAVVAPWLKPAATTDLILTISLDGDIDVMPLTIPPAATVSAAASQPTSDASAPEIVHLAMGAIGGFLAAVLVLGLLRRRPLALGLTLLAATLMHPGPARAHEGHDHGDGGAVAIPTGDQARRQPNGTVFVPKPTQRLFEIRTVVADWGRHRQSVELPARVIPDPDASGHVQSIVGGRLFPPPNGFPKLGTRVKAGDILAYVTPPLQAIDLSDMRQRQGELDQQIAIAERKLARSVALAQSGTLAKAQYEDAMSELEGLKQRRAFLDASRREAEPLTAPVSGVIADGMPVAGQVAQANALVFQIIDPSRLWVEALSFDTIVPEGKATARTVNGVTYSLSFRGAGLADRNQAVPIHFAIEGDVTSLRAGQFLSISAETRTERTGIAVSRAGIVRGANGQSVAYVHVAPELFEPRPVKVEPLDGARLLVTGGLKPGDRVVVQAAELIDQIR